MEFLNSVESNSFEIKTETLPLITQEYMNEKLSKHFYISNNSDDARLDDNIFIN